MGIHSIFINVLSPICTSRNEAQKMELSSFILHILQHKPVLCALEDVIKATAKYVPNLGYGFILLPFKNLFF